MGLKLHEDWGTTPAAIDNCLAVAEQHDVQVLHSTCHSRLFTKTRLNSMSIYFMIISSFL